MGLLFATALAAAGVGGAASLHAATPGDPAGVPFATFARALASGDYALACEQISRRRLREIAPQIPTIAVLRRTCASDMESGAEWIDKARYATTRVVSVKVTPGRARVTVLTTFHDIEPRETGIAILEDGAWKILRTPSGPHIGSVHLYRIPSESMKPTLQIGDTALVDQAAYRRAKPAVGDVVVLYPPAGAEAGNECGRRPPEGQACAVADRRSADVRFIKRIVAGPGDRIAIRRGRVIRNGKRAREPFIAPCKASAPGCDFPRAFTVAAGHYYVLGDNRGASDDSRFWGPVAARKIVGRMSRVIPRS